MTFNSHIIELYFFKLSRIHSTISQVQHHFLAIAQPKQPIAHALSIEPKCLHGKKLSWLEG